MNVCLLINAVGHDRTLYTREYALHSGVVCAYDSQSVEREIVQELQKCSAQSIEVAGVCTQMIIVDVRHDGEHRLQVSK